MLSLILIFLLVGSILFTLNFFSHSPIERLGILFSSILCSLTTAFLTLLWRPVFRELLREDESEKDLQINELKKQLDRAYFARSEEQSKNEELENQLHLLTNTTMNSSTSTEFIGYTKDYSYEFSLPEKKTVGTPRTKMFGRTSTGKEILYVLKGRISYELGIDFRKIRCVQTKNTVTIYGMNPELKSSPKIEWAKTGIQEIRNVKKDKNGRIKETEVDYSAEGYNLLNEAVEKDKEDYRKNFMMETDFEESKNEMLVPITEFFESKFKSHGFAVEFEKSMNTPQEGIPLKDFIFKEKPALP